MRYWRNCDASREAQFAVVQMKQHRSFAVSMDCTGEGDLHAVAQEADGGVDFDCDVAGAVVDAWAVTPPPPPPEPPPPLVIGRSGPSRSVIGKNFQHVSG
jgi:hypothetical protein